MPMTMTGDEAQTQQAEAQAAWLKTNALAALAKAYGPQYGDPEGALQASSAQTVQAKVPYAAPEAAANVQKTQAETAQTQAATAEDQRKTGQQNLFTLGKLLMPQPDAQGHIDPTGALDTSLFDNPAIQRFAGMTPEQAAQAKAYFSGPGGVGKLQNAMQAGMGPAGALASGSVSYGTLADGTNVMITHNKAGQPTAVPIPGNAQPTQVETANTGQVRAQTGQGTLAERQRHDVVGEGQGQQRANTGTYNAGVRANNSAYGAPSGAPATGVTTDLIHPGAQSQVPQLSGKPLATRTSAAQSVVNANTMLANTNKIIDQASTQIGSFTTGPGGELAHLPGTAATDLAHNLATVKANVAQAVLTSMKGANGSTGIGRILQSEYQNFQQVLGAVDPTQSAGAVRFHLGLVRQSLARLNKSLNDSFKTQFSTDPYTALGEKPPSAAPSKPPPGLKLPPGFTYVGPAQ